MIKSDDKMNDLRVRKTRDAIRNACIELLKTTPPAKVMIKDIATEATISRKTFYLHYSSIYDVIDDVLNELYDEIRTQTVYNPGEDGLYQAILAVFSGIDRYRMQILTAKSVFDPDFNACVGKFEEKVLECECFKPFYGNDGKMSDFVKGYMQSIFFMYVSWVTNHPETDADEIDALAKNCAHLLSSGIAGNV